LFTSFNSKKIKLEPYYGNLKHEFIEFKENIEDVFSEHKKVIKSYIWSILNIFIFDIYQNLSKSEKSQK
jgi:hypothetical protein